MNLFKTLSLFALFGLSSCQVSSTEAPQQERYKTILIAADGIVDVEPNMASFSVSISAEKKKMADSRQLLAERQAVLLEILKEFEIEESEIQTGYISFRKNYKWVNASNIFIGYISSLSTSITLKDISKIDELYARLFEVDYLNPSSISFSHGDLESYGKEAYQEALKNANSTVDKILEEMDESEKEILRIGNAGLPQIGENHPIVGLSGEIVRKQTFEYDDYKQKIEISNGSLRVTKNLSVEYKIY